MRIYLISLEQDQQRRIELAERFPQNYPKMLWIKAINGKKLPAKDYFYCAQQYFNIHKKLITPSEVGCTLSHIKALETFLESDDEYCLILEDDVIGCDKDITYIMSLVTNNKINDFVLCGGQDGLNFLKYIMAKKNIDNLYFLPIFSMKFLFRTCSYIVNKKTARYIIKKQKKKLEIADAWYEIFKKSNISLSYLNLLNHPEDLSNSHIENERSRFYMVEKNFFKRIYKQGLFWKIYNRLRNDIYRWILILKGYKQIHKDKP